MSIPPARSEDLELAITMADRTSPIALKWFSSADLITRSKADGSPVTQADEAVERYLREMVAEADPTAGVIGEEEGRSSKDSPRLWFFDPIDGTTSFVHGVPLFSTLIALHDEHGPAIGVISLPALGEVIAAGRGLGCTLNRKPCSVSSQSTMEGALVTTWG
ncbi:MAG: inositol monophosphatase family protein, partial [Candidatus Dormibacteraceae bacterium]